jgi:hypothetical protein
MCVCYIARTLQQLQSTCTDTIIQYTLLRDKVDRDSVVGIATGYRLDGPGIESRWG